jgi:hypothetical protein
VRKRHFGPPLTNLETRRDRKFRVAVLVPTAPNAIPIDFASSKARHATAPITSLATILTGLTTLRSPTLGFGRISARLFGAELTLAAESGRCLVGCLEKQPRLGEKKSPAELCCRGRSKKGNDRSWIGRLPTIRASVARNSYSMVLSSAWKMALGLAVLALGVEWSFR